MACEFDGREGVIGYTQVEMRQRQQVQRLCLPLGEPAAVGRAADWIESCAGGPISNDVQLRLSARFARWHIEEAYANPAEALARLRELADLPENLVPWPYMARARPVDEDARSVMSRTLAALDARQFTLSGDTIKGLRACGAWDRAMLLTPDDDGILRITFVGDTLAQRFGWRQARRAIGQPADHHFGRPDRYFSRSSREYRTVLLSGEPCRHHVDTLIPDGDLSGICARVQYDRIVVKIRLASGAPAVLVTTWLRPGLFPLVAVGGTARPSA